VGIYTHQSVLLAEVGAALAPRAGGVYVDGTTGGGGHAELLLSGSSPGGRLYGCDRDEAAVVAARLRLDRFAGRFEVRQGNYTELGSWVPAGGCDGVLLDLGASSHQLDEPARGFSFRLDGPLDMRFDPPRQAVTAAELVNALELADLVELFQTLGGEREALRVARAIVRAREVRPLRTTRELAGLVERVLPRRGGASHPATKVFQALRMAVNDELGSLARGLGVAWSLLKAGGRLAVITFHSGEDRLVKEFGRGLVRDYEVAGAVDVPELRRPRVPPGRWVSRKAVRPGAAEVAANRRARSAQLRVIERVH
jgi:16S rRNA (cytosine1402-N4)-methyltransferase